MAEKKSIFIEVTTTNNCNCKCAYCFEGSHDSCKRNLAVEARQLELIVKACNEFDASKYDKLTLSFWGGEPFLNSEFMFKLIESTCDYEFVQYHCYSNGLLKDEYAKLVQLPCFDKIKPKLHIQLSYDGEPHHKLKRGDNGSKVVEMAQFLQDHGVMFSFKATLSYDLIDKLPQIWDSYKALADRFGSTVQYFPTLDTSTSPSDESFEQWKKATVEVAKKEFQYIQEHNVPLWQWLANGRKMNCALGNSVHLHNDGNIYVCHGCPYLANASRFVTANIFNIQSLYEAINEKFSMELDQRCIKCGATHCSACHVSQLRDDQDIYKDWSLCRSNDQNKCKYYKWFGYIAKLLKLEVLKSNRI